MVGTGSLEKYRQDEITSVVLSLQTLKPLGRDPASTKLTIELHHITMLQPNPTNPTSPTRIHNTQIRWDRNPCCPFSVISNLLST